MRPAAMAFDEGVAAGRIELMGEETDNAFMENVMAMVNDRESVAKVADDFHVVYTPFHGCGWKLVPQALRALGVKHSALRAGAEVRVQPSPRWCPPIRKTPRASLWPLRWPSVGADFIIGTDPDSDRVGIWCAARTAGSSPCPATEPAAVGGLSAGRHGAKRQAAKDAVLLKTIVTTEMARRVAEAHGVTCYDTFTGFKFMAEKKQQLESQGLGKAGVPPTRRATAICWATDVRDKDAGARPLLLLTEMAAWYQSKGMTLFDALQALYEKYGYYGEKTHNLVMPGLDGLEKMAALMKGLRDAPPADIAGVAVTKLARTTQTAPSPTAQAGMSPPPS